MFDVISKVQSLAVRAPDAALVTWDSPVFAGPILSPRGEIIPGIAGVYAENGAFLGSYSNGAKILPNLELVSIFEEALRDLGIYWERSIRCNGATFRAKYVLGITVPTPDGRPVNLVVEIQNSYDGSLKVGAIIQALRLICANGMMGVSSLFDLARKHSARLDAKGLAQIMGAKVESEAQAMASLFATMAERQISRDVGRNIIRNLSGVGPIPARVARQIEDAFSANASPGSDDIAGTLWGLMQAGTFVLSNREREGTVAAGRQNAYWGEVMKGLALPAYAHAKLTWERLVAPRSEADAYPARGE